jgi:hypothetical protein
MWGQPPSAVQERSSVPFDEAITELKDRSIPKSDAVRTSPLPPTRNALPPKLNCCSKQRPSKSPHLFWPDGSEFMFPQVVREHERGKRGDGNVAQTSFALPVVTLTHANAGTRRMGEISGESQPDHQVAVGRSTLNPGQCKPSKKYRALGWHSAFSADQTTRNGSGFSR